MIEFVGFKRSNFLSAALLWAATQSALVISYRRFGTTHRSLLQSK